MRWNMTKTYKLVENSGICGEEEGTMGDIEKNKRIGETMLFISKIENKFQSNKIIMLLLKLI